MFKNMFRRRVLKPFDPSQLADPIALQTEWTYDPRFGEVASGGDHKLVEVSSDRLEYKFGPEGVNKAILLAIAGGAMLIGLRILSDVSRGNLPFAVVIVILLFVLAFAIFVG